MGQETRHWHFVALSFAAISLMPTGLTTYWALNITHTHHPVFIYNTIAAICAMLATLTALTIAPSIILAENISPQRARRRAMASAGAFGVTALAMTTTALITMASAFF